MHCFDIAHSGKKVFLLLESNKMVRKHSPSLDENRGDEPSMAQIKIYGVRERLNPVKEQLSDVIHACVVEAFELPMDKKFHRFFPMNREDFYFPEGRTDRYTVIEISIFEGRTVEAKKQLIRLLFERIQHKLHISTQDVEITIFETPQHDWGIRGVPGDELTLGYNVNI